MILAFTTNPGAVFNLQKLFRLDGRLCNAVHTFLNLKAKVGVDLSAGQRASKQLGYYEFSVEAVACCG